VLRQSALSAFVLLIRSGRSVHDTCGCVVFHLLTWACDPFPFPVGQVVLDNEGVADAFSGALISSLASAVNRSVGNAGALLALRRSVVVSKAVSR
jgi:hypothetical protein